MRCLALFCSVALVACDAAPVDVADVWERGVAEVRCDLDSPDGYVWASVPSGSTITAAYLVLQANDGTIARATRDYTVFGDSEVRIGCDTDESYEVHWLRPSEAE